jgi:hypothetical protein
MIRHRRREHSTTEAGRLTAGAVTAPRHRRLLICIPLLAAVAASSGVAWAPNRKHISTAPTTSDPLSLATALAAPWPRLQRLDGEFDDVLRRGRRRGRYAAAVLGLALLNLAIRNHDSQLRATAFRALSVPLRLSRGWHGSSVFETWAMATAYNLGRRLLSGDPGFVAIRQDLEHWLRRVRPKHLRVRPTAFFNKQLVEALTWLELVRTGLRSPDPRTVLHNPGMARRRARQYLDAQLPHLTGWTRRPIRGEPARQLFDHPAGAPAYHALSVGFLARAIEIRSRRESDPALRTLREAVRWSVAAAAPDGDLSYAGRSQEQAWALSMTAYGADLVAERARSASAAAFRTLVRAALRRLAALHPPQRWGLATVPALAGSAGPFPGLDAYADGPGYAGLTILGLAWLGERESLTSEPPHPLVEPRSGTQELGDLAIVNSRSVWLAVRRTAAASGDLRSDLGIVALKRRFGDEWRDIVPLRPRSVRLGTAGPVLLTNDSRAVPSAGRFYKVKRGVDLSVRFGERRTRLRWRITRCGVRLRWWARSRQRYEYSLFVPVGPIRPRIGRREVRAAGLRVAFSRPATVRVLGGYASAMNLDLGRLRVRFVPRGVGEFVSVGICGRGTPAVAGGVPAEPGS